MMILLKILSKFWRYLRSVLGPLNAILDHGIQATYISIILLAVFILSHFFLPAHIVAVAELIETIFFIILAGTLCLYTFVLFLWNLVEHLWEELAIGIRKTRNRIASRLKELDESSSVRQLPEGTQDDYVNTDTRRTIEPEMADLEREHGDEN